jgi:hypothetical protein
MYSPFGKGRSALKASGSKRSTRRGRDFNSGCRRKNPPSRFAPSFAKATKGKKATQNTSFTKGGINKAIIFMRTVMQ